MKHSLFPAVTAFAGLLLLCSCIPRQEGTEGPWPPVNEVTRPWSRWWWLGSDVDTANIGQLMETYAEAGLGGMEITPIYGVMGRESHTIEFLSGEWMEMLKATIEAAERHGMGIDMNLGTGWPFGGPQITPDVAASRLILRHYRVSGGPAPERILPDEAVQVNLGATLEALLAWNEQGTMTDLTAMVGEDGVLAWEPGPGNWQLVAAFCGRTGQQVKRAAPGGKGPTMDHFSREALEVYLARFDAAFDAFSTDGGPGAGGETGKGRTGVRSFFNDSYEVYGASWTPGFFDAFLQKRGYDLRTYLRELGGLIPADEELVARLKSDYRETMSQLLLEQFTEPWTDWSHRKGSLTRNQAHGSPGNLIDLYAAVDIPECEIFGHRTFEIPGMRANDDDTRNVEPNPMMLKLATSAAHVTNKPLVSNETFTWLGEHFKVALSQCKPEVEEAFLAGINHVFYHGTPYSPDEAAWPGWLFYASVHFGPTNSWWPHLEGLNRYITRCQSVLQSGQAHNEVLVYWPVYDLWHDAGGMEMMLTVHNIEEWLVYPGIAAMARDGYSYDFISDALLAKVESRQGVLWSAGGAVSHRVLVVPACRLMPLSTLEKILALARGGGVVVFQELPADVPGLYDLDNRRKAFKKLLAGLSFNDAGNGIREADLGEGKVLLSGEPGRALAYAGIPAEQISRFGLKYTRRTSGEGIHYYLVNHSAEAVDEMVPLRYGSAPVAVMDPQDGHFGRAHTETHNGNLRVRVQLQPGESVFLQTDSRIARECDPWLYESRRLDPVEITGHWQLTFADGGPSLPAPLNMETPFPWTTTGDRAMEEFSGTATYTVTFTWEPAQADGAGDVLLRLGKVHESARVRLNGEEFPLLWSIPFETSVGHLLREGENRLEIEVANLMANRIRAMDRAGETWRIFHEINFVNIAYEPFDASDWQVEPSGLAGPVTLVPVEFDQPVLQ